MEDLPQHVEANAVYLIGEPYPWSLLMVCPCGCQEPVELSILQDTHPHWQFRTHFDGTLSVSPSVWLIASCGAHFTITRGEIRWHSCEERRRDAGLRGC